MKRKMQVLLLFLVLIAFVFATYTRQKRFERFQKIQDWELEEREDDFSSFKDDLKNKKPTIQFELSDEAVPKNYVVDNPRVDYVENPVGIDRDDFFFSWELVMQNMKNGQKESLPKQKAYQIQLWDEEGNLFWDSGCVNSSKTTGIYYTGPKCKDFTQYTYQIGSFDTDGNCVMSDKAYFTTAYVQGKPFEKAQFIGMDSEENVYGDGQPVFYKAFSMANKKIKKAYYIGSALGQYDAYINGQRIGMDECKPGWTDYNDTLLYNVYDVTELLQANEENYLAVMLGTGWWCGRNGFLTYGIHQPALIGEVLLCFADGSSEKIVTDDTWQYYKDTRIQFGDFFNGEIVDFNKISTAEIATNQMKELDGKPVVLNHDFSGVFKSFYGYQYKNAEEYAKDMKYAYTYEEVKKDGTTYGSVLVKEEKEKTGKEQPVISLKKGQTMVVDFNQNMAGVPELTFLSRSENEIQITFAEMLNDSGEEERGNDGPRGSVYRKNYRSAETTVTILPRPGEKTTYSPTFFFTGFRYLSITAKEDVTFYSIRGLEWTNTSPVVGDLLTDNGMVNQLYQNVLWSQRNNYTLIATDCPQRDERLGWSGDLRAFAQTSMYNQDLYSFYSKWVGDLIDAQTEEGAFTDTIPNMSHTGSGNGGWAEVGIFVPWQIYQKYGDIVLLQKAYPAMKKYMDYLEKHSQFEGGPVGPGNIYGDWLSKQLTDSDFLSVLWYVSDSRYMEKIAIGLGEKEDAKQYKKLYQKLSDYVQRTYLDKDEKLETYSQTELCFLLENELLSGKQKKTAVKALCESVETNQYLLMTGFAGTPILLHVLCDVGRTDLAYRVLLAEDNPSWMYSIKQGATTIWERYDSYTKENGFADAGMNSFDHFNEGSVAQWMYEKMLGICVDFSKETPIVIHPYLPNQSIALKQCQGSYHSVLGDIEVKWVIGNEGRARISVQIPCNTKAEVQLPLVGFKNQILEGGSYHFTGEVLNYKEH